MVTDSPTQPTAKPVQLTLFPVSDAERDLLQSSPRYREAGEVERRFAVAWLELLREAPKTPSIEQIAGRAGVGRTKGYELVKSPEVARLLREAAQAHGDGLADVAGSLAYDLLCLDALDRVRRGELTAANVPAATVRLLESATARMGRDPRLAVMVAGDNGRGGQAAVYAEGTGQAVEALLGKLGATKLGDGGGRTDVPPSEHESADSVRECLAVASPDTSREDSSCA